MEEDCEDEIDIIMKSYSEDILLSYIDNGTTYKEISLNKPIFGKRIKSIKAINNSKKQIVNKQKIQFNKN